MNNFFKLFIFFCITLAIIPINCSQKRKLDMNNQVAYFSNDINAKISASSTLTDKNEKYLYNVMNIFDQDLKTTWAEGVKGSGRNEYINIKFNKKTIIEGLLIFPGLLKNSKLFTLNNAPLSLDLYFDKKKYKSYDLQYNSINNDNIGCHDQHTDYYLNMKGRIIYFKKPVKVKEMKIVFTAISCGSKYNDLCISELSLIMHNKTNEYIDDYIISFLKRLRDRKFSEIEISSNIKIDNLNKANKKILVNSHSIDFNRHDYVIDRHLTLNKEKAKIYQNYFKYNYYSFIDQSIITYKKDNSHIIFGQRSYKSRGGSEWIEAYPYIELKDRKINKLYEKTYYEYTGSAGDSTGVIHKK